MPKLDFDLVPDPPASPSVLAARQRRTLVAGLGGGRSHDAMVAARAPCAERRMRATDTAAYAFLPELADGAGRSPARPDARAAPRERAGGFAGAGGHLPHQVEEGVDRDGGAAPFLSRAAGPVGTSAAVESETAVGDDGPAVGRRAASPPSEPASGMEPGMGEDAAVGAQRSADASPRAADRDAPDASPAAAPRRPLRLDDALVVPAGALLRGYLRCRALLLAGDIVGNVHCVAGPVVIRAGASLKGRLVAAGDVYVSGIVGDSGGGAVITTRGKLTLAPGARVDGDVRSGRLDLYDGAVLIGVARASED